ncbi:phosphopantetheine-binding protein [Prosthecobacter sp.]|jgi:acyl carrier protein|uniref:phosphopantetheine-binding protein n=1 Tax=Prosthecobacter sp. TaxID=1965333 RepID=UPI002486FCBF|nr:phosphopantetheine-binding protein [Prosthecobacter sp.]MCF7784499.1 acyl carrier protein [Prosthecobacter sp.]MDI1315663.1 phosphopantetheine-binding protein [Prosthecobacter sp.]
MPTRQRLKELMISELMLDMAADEIGDDTPLFGPAGIGLDSVDALQLVVMIEKHFGFKMADQDQAKRILQSVNTIAEAVDQKAAA